MSQTISSRITLEGVEAFGKQLQGITQPLKTLLDSVGIKDFASSLLDYSSQTKKLSDFSSEVGLSVEALQTWRYSAEKSGVGADKFNKSIEEFSKRLKAAKTGTGDLSSALKKTNPELLEQLKTAKSTEEALQKFIQAMRDSGSASKKSALAVAGFSKKNMKMADFAAKTAAELAAQREEKSKLGTISKEAAKANERFSASLKFMGETLEGVRVSFMNDFMPAIATAAEGIQKFIENNPALVKWGVIIGSALGMATASFAAIGFALSQVVVPLSLLTSVLSGPFLAALRVVGAVAVANPIIASIAAIAGAAYLIYDNWGQITQFFEDKISGVVAAFGDGFWPGIRATIKEFNLIVLFAEALDGLFEYIVGYDLAEAGRKLIASLSDPVKEDIIGMIDWLSEAMAKITGVFSLISSGVKSILPDFLGGSAEESGTQTDAAMREKVELDAAANRSSMLVKTGLTEFDRTKREAETRSPTQQLSLPERVSQAAQMADPVAQNAMAQANNTNVKSQIDVNIANAPPGTTVHAMGDGAPTIRHHSADRGTSMVGALA